MAATWDEADSNTKTQFEDQGLIFGEFVKGIRNLEKRYLLVLIPVGIRSGFEHKDPIGRDGAGIPKVVLPHGVLSENHGEMFACRRRKQGFGREAILAAESVVWVLQEIVAVFGKLTGNGILLKDS